MNTDNTTGQAERRSSNFIWRDVSDKILVGVGTAIILTALGIAWNGLSNGQLIGLLGGLSKADADERIANAVSAALSELRQPAGAVVAFDSTSGCPDGWTEFEPAKSRFIIGAAETPPDNVDMNGQQLSARPFRVEGGEEKHSLTLSEMPPHTHSLTLNANWGFGKATEDFGWSADDGTVPSGSNVAKETSQTPAGPVEAHNTMPPFISLYYCRADER